MQKVYNVVRDKIENLPNFMQDMTEEELNSYNLHIVVYNSKPDSRYFTYNEVGAIDDLTNKYIVTYTPVERDVDEVKARMISDVKKVQEKKLEKTDWKVIRAMRKGIALSPVEQAESDLVYSESSRVESEINALTTIDDLVLYEATPEDVEVEELDENMVPTGNLITITRNKNNVTEW